MSGYQTFSCWRCGRTLVELNLGFVGVAERKCPRCATIVAFAVNHPTVAANIDVRCQDCGGLILKYAEGSHGEIVARCYRGGRWCQRSIHRIDTAMALAST